jgi:hypothetical protein
VRRNFLLVRLHNVHLALLRGNCGLTLRLLRLRFITVLVGVQSAQVTELVTLLSRVVVVVQVVVVVVVQVVAELAGI